MKNKFRAFEIYIGSSGGLDTIVDHFLTPDGEIEKKVKGTRLNRPSLNVGDVGEFKSVKKYCTAWKNQDPAKMLACIPIFIEELFKLTLNREFKNDDDEPDHFDDTILWTMNTGKAMTEMALDVLLIMTRKVLKKLK